jgi:hypothetical protein
MSYVSCYGSVKVLRGYCAKCKSWAIVQNGKYLCCDDVCSEPVKGLQVISPAHQRRGRPSPPAQTKILAGQENLAFIVFASLE